MKTIFSLIIALFIVLNLSAQQSPNMTAYTVVSRGEALLEKDSADAAIALGEKLLKQTKPDAFLERQALFVLGRAHFEANRPEKSAEYTQRCMALSLAAKDEFLQERAMISLAAAYGAKDEPQLDSSEQLLTRALPIAQKLQDTHGMVMAYRRLSNVFYLNGDFENAVKWNILCENALQNASGLELDKALNKYAKANSLMELYDADGDNTNLREARKCYEYAVATFHQLNRLKYEAHARNAYAGCLLYFGATDTAEMEANKSIKLGLDLNNDPILLNGYYTLSNLYEMKADAANLKTALQKVREYLVKSGNTSDFVFVQKVFAPDPSKTSLSQIDTRIDMVSKGLENTRLKNILIGLLLILPVFFLYLHRERKLLQQKKRLLQKELENLAQTREIEYISAKLEGEEQGRQRIARQIHDGVGGLFISTKWNLESALEELPHNEEKVSSRLKENLRLQEFSYQELRRVMYQLEQTTGPWWESLETFCRQLSNHKKVNIEFYPYNLDESTQKIGEEIRLIIQELITNALKHANATEISIQVSLIDGELDVIVEDNGKGFDKKNLTKGIGLRSIEDRVKRLGGNWNLESGVGTGTIMFIDVPVNKSDAKESTSLQHASVN